jgi:hypothetical protein
MRIALALVAILGCGCGGAPYGSVAPPAPASTAAPAPAAAPPWSGWWEVDDVEAAGVLGGAALRLGVEPAILVMPTIPAFETCRATVTGARFTVTGIGQDAAATLAGDRMDFDGGFGAHRASPARAAELDRIIPAVQAACDHARACYRAALPLLGQASHEAEDFGPLLRSDACANIVTNLAGDLQAASKAVPGACR